ncbi:hypothetical protein EA74_02848 [Enterococcus hirae]|nr:hypothetical protein EB07_02986 [Enterococcus hirae]RBT46268.1 hypothetical protein EA74_02848 [Enterococcus hirae]RBT46535.1 hypothetical protein EB20_02578 [Enterococcus hirae]RBT46922.1 hypothetical protein EB10_02733 [Enterococcus hirae]RBT51590.1 hypothetical protein EB24_02733 [Enterococcus hirae]
MEKETLCYVINLLMSFLSLPSDKMVIAIISIVAITIYWNYSNKKNSFH